MRLLSNTTGPFWATRWIWAAVCAAALCGCNTPRDNLAVFNHHYQSDQLRPAATFAESKISGRSTPGRDDLLWALQLGAVLHHQQHFDQSVYWFDKAEDMLRHYTLQNDQIAQAIAAAVVNDNLTPYTGTIYDGILVNTYKALNFIRTGRDDLARVEFNRAVDRQRRAKEDFAHRIKEVQDKLNDNPHSSLARRSLESDRLRRQLEQTYSSLMDFEAYPGFVNPFTTYLAGVFFAATNDYPKASDLLRESTGMLPDNPFVLRDFAEVEQALNTGTAIHPTVWVFFENGLGPLKEEIRLDLPLFIATDRVYYFGIALPQLVFRPAAAAQLDIRADGQSYRTEPVADIDRIVQTEFKEAFDGILLRSILSATGKAVAQYALERHQKSTAAVLMALFSYATTAADVRIWSALPKNFQAARLDFPADGRLIVAAGRHPPITVELGDCTHAIVYVKMTSSTATPGVDVIPFY